MVKTQDIEHTFEGQTKNLENTWVGQTQYAYDIRGVLTYDKENTNLLLKNRE